MHYHYHQLQVGRMDEGPGPNSPPPEEDVVIAGGCLEPANMNDGGAAATCMEGGEG